MFFVKICGGETQYSVLTKTVVRFLLVIFDNFLKLSFGVISGNLSVENSLLDFSIQS